MTDTPKRLKIDYVEFTSPALEQTQTFFNHAFGWDHIEYGDDYRDIQGAGTGGGIARGELRAPLPVLKADDLEAALEQVKSCGAKITREIFERIAKNGG